MDRKSILVLVLCFLLLLLWTPLVNKIYPPRPVARGTNAPAPALGQPASPAPGPTLGPGSNLPPSLPTPGTAADAAAQIRMPAHPSASWIRPAATEQLLDLNTPEAVYTFTSHGGGLKAIELTGYPESVACGRNRAPDTNRLANLNLNAPVPALALFGGPGFDDPAPFALSRTARGVRVEKTLTNGLHVIKEFAPLTNHLLQATLRLENRTATPITLPPQELVVGTATPISRYDDGQLVRVEWFDGAESRSVDQGWFANRTLGCIPGTPRPEYASEGASNVVWAAVQNQFFALAAVPQAAAPRMLVRPVDLPAPSPEERAADSRLTARPVGYQTAFLYPAAVLEPGQALERQLEVFAGPKEYNTLARLGRNLDLIMGFTGFFGWFAKLLLLSMNGLHAFGLSYGLTIIAITIVIKILFWPLTQASTRSMKRMQALQPQMKAIQEKYKEDPKKMNTKLMEFMKEHKVSPLGGCLPLLLQIPVFFGFFQMLRSAIELRGARFLWACDLSQPDTIALIFGVPINPLPLIMGATQFWQARLTPPSPGVDPIQQKMMQYMPLIFVFMLYNFSAGLALYWTVQNLLSILQMKLTRSTGEEKPKTPAPPTPPAPAPTRKRK